MTVMANGTSGNSRTRSRRRLAAAGVILALSLAAGGCRHRDSAPGELTRLAGVKTDKGNLVHRYTEVYELFFSPLKDTATRIFEIGIAGGGSLEMWRDYFPKATIYGIDIYPKTELDSARIKTFVADQSDRRQLAAFIDKFGGYFDIIIDDGGHSMDQQQISVGFLFKYLKPGGYYVIEDVHTSLPEFWSGFGVEPGGANSTLTMINHFIATGRLESRYLAPAEAKYLTKNIEFCNLFSRNNRFHSMTCLLKKRTSLKR
jgi:demethylmacrocin O-methyltransferase